MSKLTNSQVDLLMFSYYGNCIEVCTSVGRSLGKTVSKVDLPYGFTKAMMNTLVAWGMYDQVEIYGFGLRWCRLSLSQKGFDRLEKEGAICERRK